jgi:hypothetical protein
LVVTAASGTTFAAGGFHAKAQTSRLLTGIAQIALPAR